MLKKKDILSFYKSALTSYAEYRYSVEVEKDTSWKFMYDSYDGKVEAYATVLLLDSRQIKVDKEDAFEAYRQFIEEIAI